MPPQIPTWIGMYFVVAFSSCLDVAAIQMDLGEQLDFNRELTTVGISNVCRCTTIPAHLASPPPPIVERNSITLTYILMCTGGGVRACSRRAGTLPPRTGSSLVGGFTGSYILSQTIFTMRTGARPSPSHLHMRTEPSTRMRTPLTLHAHGRAPHAHHPS